MEYVDDDHKLLVLCELKSILFIYDYQFQMEKEPETETVFWHLSEIDLLIEVMKGQSSLVKNSEK